MKKIFILILTLIMVLGAVGCSNQDYEEALELYEKGNYEEAQSIFAELGDYENSAEMVQDCIYNRALVFLGRNHVEAEAEGAAYATNADGALDEWVTSDTDLKEALALLESISEYKDATQLIEEVNTEKNYREAKMLFENGEFDLAEPLFVAVGEDYRDEAYKYIAAIPLLKEYANTTWKYDDGYEENGWGNTIWPTITVKINAPYRIDDSDTFSDCDWSVYADIEIAAEIVEVGGGITNFHFNYEELIPHNEADEKNQLSEIFALYINDEFGSTFANVPGAPYSKILLSGTTGDLTLTETPYSADWNTSYIYDGKSYSLVKQN